MKKRVSAFFMCYDAFQLKRSPQWHRQFISIGWGRFCLCIYSWSNRGLRRRRNLFLDWTALCFYDIVLLRGLKRKYFAVKVMQISEVGKKSCRGQSHDESKWIFFSPSGSFTVSSFSQRRDESHNLTIFVNSSKSIPLLSTELPDSLVMAVMRASHNYYSLLLNFYYLLNELLFKIF